MPPTDDLSTRAAGHRSPDRWIMPAVLLLLIAAQIAATRSYSLFTRGLWLDEYHTLLIVDDPSLSHAMEALKHGADTNAPGLYLLSRAVAGMVGSSDPIVLRGIGFASVLLGLVGLYLTVRRSYSPTVGLITTLAVWSHPLITRQSFEARFYGPWFAGIVWFAYGLDAWDRSRRKAWPSVLIASLSVFVCTIHYLGIMSLVLVATAHTLMVGKSWRLALARLIPVAAGPIALAACMPFYFGQKRSLSVPTWIEPPGLTAVRSLFDSVYCYYIFAIPVAGLFVTMLMARNRRDETPTEDGDGLDRLVGLTSLAFMPLVLVAFSFSIQSVLIERYAVATVAAFAPLVAPLVARTARPCRWAVLVALLLVSTANLKAATRWFSIVDARRHEAAAQVAELADAPVLFRNRMELYEFWWDLPSLRGRFFLWSVEDRGDRTSDRFLIERDMAKNHERWYGLAREVRLAMLRDRPIVYLYGIDADDVLGLERSDPDLNLRPIDRKSGLYEATRPNRELSLSRGWE